MPVNATYVKSRAAIPPLRGFRATTGLRWCL